MGEEQALKSVIRTSGCKVRILKKIVGQSDSFVFLDPPYYPVMKKNGKPVAMNKLYNISGGFTPLDFLKLKMRCDELTFKGIPFLFSNSDCEFIRILFKDYPIISVEEPHEMKKAKNSDGKFTAKCVMITNFEKKEDFMGAVKSTGKVLEEMRKGVKG